jgi:vacuolar-type H+-ATPase subunit E/Vma4
VGPIHGWTVPAASNTATRSRAKFPPTSTKQPPANTVPVVGISRSLTSQLSVGAKPDTSANVVRSSAAIRVRVNATVAGRVETAVNVPPR